ncbi:hypothetical protein GCM10027052_06270 [Parafrigoribacterium mesophilum]
MVMWAVTHSIYLLAFAALGPVIALGSFLDAKWKGATAVRRGNSRFAAELRAARLAIGEAHRLERDTLQKTAPSPSRVLGSPPSDPERWRCGFDAEVPITIGSGPIPSTLVLDPPAGSGADISQEAATALRQLRQSAALLQDAPVIVDARLGIGICGPGVVAAAVARGILVQLADALSPSAAELSFGDPFGWLADLPHPRTPVRPGAQQNGTVRFSPISGSEGAPRVVVAVAKRAADLPRDCRIVLDTTAPASVVRHPEPERCGPLTPQPVTEEQARGHAAVLRRCAGEAGILGSGARLPELVPLTSLPQRPGETRSSLSCTLAAGSRGALTVDLVGDGPHAVIGGTTGSGKSELLVSWVLAMAGNHGPDLVNFLLVDFKGGSSFGPLVDLPHCVGVITDLDERSAARALDSLRAELRFRERLLARCGVRSLEDLPAGDALPRLVIVVDEFAAVVDGFPDLHGLFSDLAARGRSLGVHLILCTQRPAGVVRDAVMANCTLRICLRVNSIADSVEVVGTGAAAELTRLPLGRGYLGISGERPQLVQFALSEGADGYRAGARWPLVPLRRPWCDPLPTAIDLDRLPAAEEPGIGFAVADLPDQQRQSCAVYDPERHGNLLVVGAHGSGKSTVLAALQAAARLSFAGDVRWIPGTVPGAWDRLTAVRDELRQPGGHGRLLLLDDLDALLDRFPEDYQRAFLDLLVAVLREGGNRSVHVVLATQRSTAALQAVAALCDARLLLRLPDRQEHVMAGGTAADFVPEAAPGAGLWRGHRVQVATVPVPPPDDVPEPPRLDLSGIRGVIAVSSRPVWFAQRLRQHPHINDVVELAGATEIDVVAGGSGGATAFVADADTWQSRWSVLENVRSTLPMLFEGCPAAEFRAVTRLRTLPPPLEAGSTALWLKNPAGNVSRVRL